MPLSIEQSSSIMLLYADDATMSVAGRDVSDVEAKLSQTGESVSHWCTENMAVSLPKFNSMVTLTRQKLSQAQQLHVQTGNSSIPCVTASKL